MPTVELRYTRHVSSRARWRLAGLLTVTFLIYAAALGYSPPHLHSAEVMFALHANSIAHTAHDLYGRFMPLYFQMRPLGEHTWWHPVIVYWMAPFLRFMPPWDWVVRLPTVLVGVADVALVYFIARRLFGRERWALLSAALLALTPAHFIQSRIAMDYIYPVPFMLAWLLCLLVYLERRHSGLIVLATSILGIGFYSYLAAVVMMPLYLAATLVVLLTTSDRPVRSCTVALAGFAWPLVALPFWIAGHPTMITDTMHRYPGVDNGLRASVIVERLSLYWSYFDPAFLFLSGGYASVMNSTRLVGVFLLPLLVFIPVGLWAILSARRDWGSLLVLAGFLSAPLSACLVPEPYAIDREMVLVPFGVLLAVYGVIAMFQSRAAVMRRAATVLLALVPMHFAFLCYVYFGEYRLRSAFWFEGNHRGALETIIARDVADAAPKVYLNQQRDPTIEGHWHLAVVQHGRTDLLQRTVYFDADTLDITSVPPGSLLLLTRDDARLQAMLDDGSLERIADVPELSGPSFLFVARKPREKDSRSPDSR